jgi:hypothetical protein
MSWKAEIERQVRDNRWEPELTIGDGSRETTFSRYKLIKVKGRFAPRHWLAAVNRVNLNPVGGIAAGLLRINGANGTRSDCVVHVIYKESPHNMPGLVDSTGQPPFPAVDFATLFRTPPPCTELGSTWPVPGCPS